MARARNRNQRGTSTGPFGKRRDRVLKTAGRPTPRVSDTGFGLRRPKKRRPRVSDTGFGLRRPRRPVPRPRRR